VRLVRASPGSLELCGGTHARRTGDIGLLKIVSESGIAAGVRRLEAVTGPAALAHVWAIEESLGRAAGALRAAPAELPDRVAKLLAREKEQEREIADLKRRLALEAMKTGHAASGDGTATAAGDDPVREIAGVRVHAARVEIAEPRVLRDLADAVRQRLGSGVVVLGGVADGKANLLVATTPDVRDRVHAGTLVRELAAALGARGGGKDDMAQAGGGEPAKLDAALQSVYSLVERMLAHG